MKVSKSMIDAVKHVMESGWEKEKTSTGTKVYGSSYGNSAKAKRDQTKSAVDTVKEPTKKELEESDCVTKPEVKDIAKKEVKGHEKKMHKEESSFALRLIASHYESELLEDEINEVLKKDASAGDWIHDFVHSDNPKFKGKSKAERKKMALGAYYAKQNEEKDCSCDDDHPDEKEDKALVKKMVKKNALKNEELELSESEDIKVHSKDGKHIGTITHGKYQSVAYAHPTTKFGGSKEPHPDEDSITLAGHHDTQKGIDFIHAHHRMMTEAKVVTQDDNPNRITTDMLSGRVEGGKSNAFKPFKLKLKTGGEMKAPPVEGEEESSARSSIKAHGTHVTEGRMKDIATDREESNRLHTPKKGTDVADKSYLKTAGKKPGALHNVGKGLKAFLKGKPEPMESVEVEGEQLDEISKKLAGSYRHAAAKDRKWMGHQADMLAVGIGRELEAGRPKNASRWKLGYNKVQNRINKRTAGIKAASARMKAEETELDEAVSRKDFQMVADLIKTHDDHGKRKELAQHHAEIFHRQNPRFDRARFMKAANVNEAKQPEQDNVPFAPPYNTTKDDVVTDKSGAKHTPMSRAKDLARKSLSKIKNEMLGKAPGNN
jgi:hypothetical protein